MRGEVLLGEYLQLRVSEFEESRKLFCKTFNRQPK